LRERERRRRGDRLTGSFQATTSTWFLDRGANAETGALSDLDSAFVQRRRLTPRTLILAQVVALVGLIPLVGVYLFLTHQRVLGLLLIGGAIAANGVLLERLAYALPRRPLLPRAGYRLLTIGGVVVALLALVEFVVR